MRALAVVWLKEMIENLRDRRTLVSALVFGPLFGPAMFAVMMNLTLHRVVTTADETVSLTVAGSERAPNLVTFLEQQGVAVTRAQFTAEQAREAVRADRHPIVLLVAGEYPQRFAAGQPAPVQLFSDSSDHQTEKYVRRVRALVEGYSRQLAGMRLFARGIDPKTIIPIALDEIDVSTPAGRSLVLLGMMTYFVLFSMLMGGLYLTIDTTAGERERGSLEVLFTAPVPRPVLIYGKILAACCYMLISLAITLSAFSLSLGFVPLESLGMSANFNGSVALKLFAVAAPFSLLGAALMTVVASFTRTYKEAQSYLTVVLLIPTLPILFAGLYALKASNSLMMIPSLSQHLLMTSILRDEPLLSLHVTLSVATTLALGLLLAVLAGRLYRREAILG